MSQVKNNKLIEGTITLASEKGGFLTTEEYDKDFYIPPQHLATALYKDKVKAKIFFDQQRGEKIAQVVEIVKRSTEKIVGLLIKKDGEFLVRASGKKISLKIKVENPNNIPEQSKVTVKITDWKNQSDKPKGEIVDILGMSGDNETEIQSILLIHRIEKYPENIDIDENKLRSLINEDEFKKREDFRKTTTLTIDPDDAKDFDDALSFKELPNGNYEIGVHIADVSHFVKPETPIDIEAQKRATSVYLVDRTIPMLPEILSNDLCSLVPNQDRLSFATIFEINKDAKVLKHRFVKTVINSDKRFSYEAVQEILEGKEGDFSKELNVLNDLAKKVRKQRFADGALSLDTDELKFKLDTEGRPLYAYKKKQKDTHKLIEEFMLLANRFVAQFIRDKAKTDQEDELTFVYRIHDTPNKEKIANLKDVLRGLGYAIKKDESLMDPQRLNEVIKNAKNEVDRSLIKTLVLRSMAKAIYSTENIGHFGLAFNYYTHFTSPIRRYPDIVVHRLLYAYIYDPKQKFQKFVDDYEKMAKHWNYMEKQAMEAERESVKLKQVELMLDKIGNIYTGTITGISPYGMFVEAKETLSEGMVSVKAMPGDYYEIDKTHTCLLGRKKKKKYCLGQEVKIKVISANLEKKTIDYSLVE